MKQGWEIKKLGEVSKILNGGTPKTNIKEFWDGDIYWITPADLGKLTRPTVADTPRKISRLGLEKSSAKIFPRNSVILSTRAPIGHIAINEVPMSTNQGCRGIVPSNKLDTWYLYYFLKKNVELLDSLGTGATFKELSTKALAGVEIPLPPLPEQQRIVSILDECFAAIDKAKANAEQNLKNAKELFESYLEGVFEKKGEAWKKTSLKNEIELLSGFAFKSKYYSEINDDVLLVRGDNIMQGYFRWEDVKRWNRDEFEEYKRFQLFENDVVLAMDRPWVKAGLKCAMISKNELPSLLVQRTASLRCNEDMNSSFLFYLVKSVAFTNHLLGVQTGIGVPHISGKQILEFSFNKPPLKEQQTIVRQLDALQAEMQKLEVVYQKKMADLEELKKSILQKAFAGELKTEN